MKKKNQFEELLELILKSEITNQEYNLLHKALELRKGILNRKEDLFDPF